MDTNPLKCSDLYHDQAPETPQKCNEVCDCGKLPCGVYLFDFRNGSMLLDFLIREYILGPDGLDSPLIDGYFLDDFWCSNLLNGTVNCNDPVQGPSEVEPHFMLDAGLNDLDVLDLTQQYLAAVTLFEQVTLLKKKLTFDLFANQYNANAMPYLNNRSICSSFVRPSCSSQNPFISTALLYGIGFNASNPFEFPSLLQDIATFLLIRGSHAYIGYGEWGMGWPPTLKRPKLMDTNYGVPIDPFCREISPNVFTRKWSRATITLDCNIWNASINFH